MVHRLLFVVGHDLALVAAEIGEIQRVDQPGVVAHELVLIAEELDVRVLDRLAGRRVADVVEGLVDQRLFEDGRVGHPDNDVAHVAVGHFGHEQIRAGLL